MLDVKIKKRESKTSAKLRVQSSEFKVKKVRDIIVEAQVEEQAERRKLKRKRIAHLSRRILKAANGKDSHFVAMMEVRKATHSILSDLMASLDVICSEGNGPG